MRRGRWVVYCIVIFFFCVQTSYAASLGMTATVPLSSLWKESLRLNSKAKIDTSHAHILLISQESLGIKNIPVEKQRIQLLVFKENIAIHEEEKITNKKGVVDFIFVAEQKGSYSAIIVNKSDATPFVVKNTTVSL